MKKQKKLISAVIILFLNIPLYSKTNEEMLRDILSDKRENIKNDLNFSKKDKSSFKIKKDTKENKIKNNDISLNEKKDKKEAVLPIPSTDDKILLESGIDLFKGQNFSSAIEKFKILLQKYPDSPFKDQALIWKSRSHVKVGEPETALKDLEKIAENSGEYPNAVFTSGLIYMKQKDYIKATDALYKCANQYPEHELADNALLNLSKIYLRNNKGSLALGSILKLLTQYYDRETEDDAYFILAKIFEKDPFLKDFEKARNVYKKFIKKADIENNENFKNSPLLKVVRKNLFNLEREFFNK